jgi:hypothetical protein
VSRELGAVLAGTDRFASGSEYSDSNDGRVPSAWPGVKVSRSKADESFDAPQAKFLSRPPHVRVDRVDTNVDLFCDHPRLDPSGEKLQALTFSLREQRQIAWQSHFKRTDRYIGRVKRPHPPAQSVAPWVSDLELRSLAQRN